MKAIKQRIDEYLQDHIIPVFLIWKITLGFCLRRAGKQHGLESPLIVSLTSYPSRFDKLPFSLKCLLSQSMVADRVILWIAHEDKSKLTPAILELQKKGLEIFYCDELRSFKKIIPTLKYYPDSIVITADDDLYYGFTWLEELVRCHKEHPNDVICHRAHRIVKDENDLPLPYLQWDHILRHAEASQLIFQTSGGGALYPVNSFHTDMLNAEVFERLCPNSDDVWLYWMMRLNGKVARKTGYQFLTYCWPGTQNNSLYESNEIGGNDTQIQAMIKVYGNVIFK